MSDRIGDKLGPKLVDLMARAVLVTRKDLAPHEARVRQVATQALIDKAGHEFADHIGPILHDAIAANPDMHKGVKDYLLRTASGQHQLQAIAGHLAMAGAGGLLQQILSNEMAPFVYSAISENPHMRLDQVTAAAAAATGNLVRESMYFEGGAYGYDRSRMDMLYNLAQAIPDSATIGQMINRRLLSEQDGRYWVARGGYGDDLHQALLDLRAEVLSPADAALAVLRTEMSQQDGAAKAALSGVSESDFNTLVLNTGEPPGAESLMEALRRDIIDTQRFQHGIVQSRIRNEWIDVLLALRYAPMSVADAVNAVVQGYFSESQAAAIAQQNGLEPGQVDTLIETAGEPLSRTELEQLYNRGLVDAATVQQGLRESRLKNKYVDDALELHVRLPEPRQVVSMVSKGVITNQQATQLLAEYGFPPDTIAFLIAEGVSTKLGAHKDLTIGEIKTLYTDGIFSAAQVTQNMATLGYDDSETAFLIQSWDLLANAAITRQAVGAIRARFVSRKLDWATTAQDLTALGVPDTAIAVYQNVWGIEQAARVATLTEAQIVKAVKDNLLAQSDGNARLVAMGYSDADAHILLGVLPGTALATTIGGTGGT